LTFAKEKKRLRFVAPLDFFKVGRQKIFATFSHLFPNGFKREIGLWRQRTAALVNLPCLDILSLREKETGVGNQYNKVSKLPVNHSA